MNSNEHGAMEGNEENLTANILIYYTHETELRMRSYDMMNRAIRHNTEKDLAEKEGGDRPQI